MRLQKIVFFLWVKKINIKYVFEYYFRKVFKMVFEYETNIQILIFEIYLFDYFITRQSLRGRHFFFILTVSEFHHHQYETHETEYTDAENQPSLQNAPAVEYFL